MEPNVWDSLAEEVRLDVAGRRCSVAVMLDAEIPAEALEAVRAVMADPAVTHNALRRALVARLGLSTPSTSALRWHRDKNCNCWKESG